MFEPTNQDIFDAVNNQYQERYDYVIDSDNDRHFWIGATDQTEEGRQV